MGNSQFYILQTEAEMPSSLIDSRNLNSFFFHSDFVGMYHFFTLILGLREHSSLLAHAKHSQSLSPEHPLAYK